MAKDYGQFCGLAKAAAVLGERWALLVVRDLMVSPRRFTDLLTGLPGLTSNVLTSRLLELEAAGVVERAAIPRPARGTHYRLTEYGRDLAPILDALGLWGARRMSRPQVGDVVTDSSLAAALRASFVPGAARRERTYAVHAGPAQCYARVRPTGVQVGIGPFEADLIVSAGPAIREVLAGSLSPREAIDTGVVAINGPFELFEEFTATFRAPLDAGESAVGPGRNALSTNSSERIEG